MLRHERQAHGEHSVACSFKGCLQLLPFKQLKRHFRETHLTNTIVQETRITSKSENERKLALSTFNAHKLFVEEIGSNPKNFVSFLDNCIELLIFE